MSLHLRILLDGKMIHETDEPLHAAKENDVWQGPLQPCPYCLRQCGRTACSGPTVYHPPATLWRSA
jgi:hypothetical protein